MTLERVSLETADGRRELVQGELLVAEIDGRFRMT